MTKSAAMKTIVVAKQSALATGLRLSTTARPNPSMPAVKSQKKKASMAG